MRQSRHCEDPGIECTGMIRRTGWTAVGINASTYCCPAWRCDGCGRCFWSYTDEDNGDRYYDMDRDDEDFYMD